MKTGQKKDQRITKKPSPPDHNLLNLAELRFGTELLKRGFASMQKGGVIMDVVNAEAGNDCRERRRCCSYVA